MTNHPLHTHRFPAAAARVLLATLITAATLLGCQSSPPPPAPATTSAPALLNAAPADDAADKQPVGPAQMWSQTCNRCHNLRSPDSYSGTEWSLVMTHMRIRGYLTGEDQRAIQEFLQSQ
jgi:hypothetical protein